MKKSFLTLAILGAIIPYAFFDLFFWKHGFSLAQFTSQLFSTYPAAGFTSDVLISSVVFWIWSYREAQQRDMKYWWAYVVVNLLVGLSCALPLFLYFRYGREELPNASRTGSKPSNPVASLAT